MNSQMMDSLSLKYRWLNSEWMMPRFMCTTPIRMDIFILAELRKGSSVLVPCQMGSRPKG